MDGKLRGTVGGDGLKPIRSVYSVIQKRVVEDHYSIEASSKADALRKFEEDKYNYGCDTYTEKDFKPTAMLEYDVYECPNKGEGWSDIPLDKLKNMKIGAFSWHYNGKCEDERKGNQTHCHHCLSAMATGKRLLTLEEKRYLKDTYSENRDLNTEE